MTAPFLSFTYYGIGPKGEELEPYEFAVPDEFNSEDRTLFDIERDDILADGMSFSWPKGSKITRLVIRHFRSYGRFDTKEEAELGALRAEGGQPS
jgi:hypothetical protein